LGSISAATPTCAELLAKSFGDEPDGPPPSPFFVGADFDGVAISEDGIVWYECKACARALVLHQLHSGP